MRTILASFLLSVALHPAAQKLVLQKNVLQDKIKGGWAGQTIGVTFGGPYEFRFNGTFIGDYQPLIWDDSLVRANMLNNPGLYDDLYMDLTFVEVMEKYGMDAPVDSFANAFAHAGYALWHANQAARYNILHGIAAPESGSWKHNPHADCIDYQIESDFAGLMSPGMPNVASAVSDKIGHIMNYGDGWYGGVFVGAMYALAFTTNDVGYIVKEALKTIPAKSEFYQCIYDVMQWHQQFPANWKQAWLGVQEKWANDVGCPDGVFAPFNIDAKVNAAYVAIGLLYGGGDFTRTMEITTRCGQDADCNPSTAGGILGTIMGYDKIPAYWKKGLEIAEDIPFKYTSMSLHDVYATSYLHALKNIEKNGGKINGLEVQIMQQDIQPVRFEKSFVGLYPEALIPVAWNNAKNELRFSFNGTGFVIKGDASTWGSQSEYIFKTQLWVDKKLIESADLPVSFAHRRHELAWQYALSEGEHAVVLKILNPSAEHRIEPGGVLLYTNKPVDGMRSGSED